MRTIACITCGVVTPARSGNQKFCAVCTPSRNFGKPDAMRDRACAECGVSLIGRGGKAKRCEPCSVAVRARKKYEYAQKPEAKARARRESQQRSHAKRGGICVCKACGISFDSGTHKRKTCDICKWLAKGYVLACPLPRNCECCGKSFTPAKAGNLGQRFCGSKCADKKGRVSNATCVVCGKGFYKNFQNRHTCSRECQRIRSRRNSPRVSVTRYRKTCTRCGVAFWSSYMKQAKCPECVLVRTSVKPRDCKTCGTFFSPLSWIYTGGKGSCQSTCSIQCHEERKRKKLKAARSRCKARRRARIHGVAHEAIDPVSVFEAAGWKCQICGRKTPVAHRGSHKPTAPELDHIVPISKGGTHTYSNVQCACRECNQWKSDRLIVGQAALFPCEGEGRVQSGPVFCL